MVIFLKNSGEYFVNISNGKCKKKLRIVLEKILVKLRKRIYDEFSGRNIIINFGENQDKYWYTCTCWINYLCTFCNNLRLQKDRWTLIKTSQEDKPRLGITAKTFKEFEFIYKGSSKNIPEIYSEIPPKPLARIFLMIFQGIFQGSGKDSSRNFPRDPSRDYSKDSFVQYYL